jgi:hypothetical protein
MDQNYLALTSDRIGDARSGYPLTVVRPAFPPKFNTSAPIK